MTRHSTGAASEIEAIAAHAGGGPRSVARAADVVVKRGHGSYLETDDGRHLLDTISGYGVASLGHSHPRWVEAVTSQARELVVSPLHTSALAGYLGALADVLPAGMDGIALTSTGAEAVEMAVRLAQTAHGKPGVLTLTDSFHGKTAAVRYTRDPGTAEARRLGPQWLRTAPFPACTGHDAVDYANCAESVTDHLAALSERDDVADVGAVLVEPVLGTAGNVPPRRRFLPALRALCRERGWLLIYDESITGLARTGSLFALETFDAEPDILVLGKGLGAGFPLSAVCASMELWGASALDSPSATSSSYGGNPLACVAGMTTLEIVTSPEFLEQVRTTADHAARRLRQLAQDSPQVARPRGVGLMLGFDLVDPESGALASTYACEAVFRACRDRGALVAAHVPRVRLNPPLTLSVAETDRLFDILRDVLA